MSHVATYNRASRALHALPFALLLTAACSGGKVTGAVACSADATKGACGQGQVCINGSCVDELTARCSNMAKDGDETGIDCGGSCGPCGTGGGCTGNDDCQSGVCSGSSCRAPSCDDDVTNGSESDTDCGGTCSPCGDGATCELGADCASGACILGVCTPPACDDGVTNGYETSVDCGGPVCAQCQNPTDPCELPSDCASGVCDPETNLCAAATCDDNVENGDETAVDCGGSCPEGCAVELPCEDDGDCQSNVCQQNICRDATCGDGSKNGSETDVDCGGSACAACGDGDACQLPGDCASRVCASDICQSATCADAVQNQNETGVDCGGSCTACPDGEPCREAGDCQSTSCIEETCRPATCTNGATDGNETDVDCGGDCAACAPGETCNDDADCQSGLCDGTVCATPSCTDGVQNGGETGADCGFVACATGCPVGGGCDTDYDCALLMCDPASHTCSAASCTDQRLNGDETGTDCGGSCPACPVGQPCVDGDDCQSGVCASTTNTCASPSCSDTVRNGDETALDCGGSCVTEGKTCPVGSACNAPADCASGQCIANMCVATHCTNATADANETDVDCGGPECPPCAPGKDCDVDSDCTSGVCDGSSCAEPSCADGVRNGDELGVDCGASCPAGCDTGTPCAEPDDCLSGVCANTLCQAPSCGDGVKNGTEVCDGGDLDGQTCAGLSLGSGQLGCSAGCASFDTSQCGVGCTDSAECSGGQVCLEGFCQCGAYQELCDGQCVTTQTDPYDCGTCGNDCVAQGKVCSAGRCMGGCLAPLVACGGRCVDPKTDNANCGGCGNDCTSASEVCHNGSCIPGKTSVAPDKCEGGGPPIVLNTGSSTPVPDDQSCTGDLASVSFRWAMCSCKDISTKPVFTDSYNSSVGPYDPICEGTGITGVPAVRCTSHASCALVGSDVDGDGLRTCAGGLGAGVGANGVYYNNQLTRVWGTLWWENASPTSNLATATVRQNLQCGGDLPGTVHVMGDAYVAGDVDAAGHVSDDLFTSASSTVNPSLTVGGDVDKTASPLDVVEPCDCASDQLVNVVGIVDAHACTGGGTGHAKCATDQAVNDNYVAQVSPDIFGSAGDGTGGRLDLSCGLYYFTEIKDGNDPITINVSGRAAIFVEGNIEVKNLILQLGDTAELDVFVKGSVCVTSFRYGSPNFPARARIYIGGGSGGATGPGGSGLGCTSSGGSTSDDAVYMPQTATIAGNMYAPWGTFDISQDLLMYGGVFVGNFNTPQSTTIHYDTAVIDAGLSCSSCGDGIVDAGEQCDGNALGGNTCLTVPGNFAGGVLACKPNCTFDTSGCFNCGNGVREAAEQCDPGDTNDGNPPPDFGTPPLTCQDLGFTSGTITTCKNDCTVDTSGCSHDTVCGDGVRQGTEECDPGDTSDSDPPPDFGTTPRTCQEEGYAGGTITTCNADCTVNTGSCYKCGDGVKNGGEDCDGADLGNVTCEDLSQPAGTLSCKADCTYDTSGCGGCTSCRDCNNQACVNGACGACTTSADCCAPLQCFFGTCTLF